MAITEERRAYYEKLIIDYEAFLARPHGDYFYARIIEFPAGYKRTNEQHIRALIQMAKEELAK